MRLGESGECVGSSSISLGADGKYRFSQIATEILTSDIQLVAETTLANLVPLMTSLWDAVLPPPTAAVANLSARVNSRLDLFTLDEIALRRHAAIRHVKEGMWDEAEERDEKRREVLRGNWMRVCGVYMGWKTAEVGGAVSFGR
jgi:hypothetical protein